MFVSQNLITDINHYIPELLNSLLEDNEGVYHHCLKFNLPRDCKYNLIYP